MKKIQVGPFAVADNTMEEVISAIAGNHGSKRAAYALHVGGLNEHRNIPFIEAMTSGQFVYADGMAIVGLAKLGGAQRIERAATTDIGLDIIRSIGRHLDRPVRVAIVGGPVGLAEAAGVEITRRVGADIVRVADGFRADYSDFLASLQDSAPDVLIVGFGMPKEAIWVDTHWDHLPESLVLTCGGWLGFLAGEEDRAPTWIQRMSLEWAFRLSRDPRRLFGRYSTGLVTFLLQVPGQLKRRSR